MDIFRENSVFAIFCQRLCVMIVLSMAAIALGSGVAVLSKQIRMAVLDRTCKAVGFDGVARDIHVPVCSVCFYDLSARLLWRSGVSPTATLKVPPGSVRIEEPLCTKLANMPLDRQAEDPAIRTLSPRVDL